MCIRDSYKDLTDAEKDIVLHGPMEKRHILYVPKNKDHATELDFTYYSAVNTVRNALAKAKDEKGMARVAKFLCESVCPDCHGTDVYKRQPCRRPRRSGSPCSESCRSPFHIA